MSVVVVPFGFTAANPQSNAYKFLGSGRKSPTLVSHYGVNAVPAVVYETNAQSNQFKDNSLLLISSTGFSAIDNVSRVFSSVDYVLAVGQSVLLDPDTEWWVCAWPVYYQGVQETVPANGVWMGSVDTEYGLPTATAYDDSAYLGASAIIAALPNVMGSIMGVKSGAGDGYNRIFPSATFSNTSPTTLVNNQTTLISLSLSWDGSGGLFATQGGTSINLSEGNWEISGGIDYAPSSLTGRAALYLLASGSVLQLEEMALPNAANGFKQTNLLPQKISVANNSTLNLQLGVYQNSGSNQTAFASTVWLNIKEIFR